MFANEAEIQALALCRIRKRCRVGEGQSENFGRHPHEKGAIGLRRERAGHASR